MDFGVRGQLLIICFVFLR